jgi:signal transduction histidine kinase
MRLQTIQRSSALRFAVGLSALSALSMAVVFAAMYWLIGSQLRSQLESSVAGELAELSSEWEAHGFDGLRDMVRHHAEEVRDANSFFVLQGLGGEGIAGNARGISPVVGRRTLGRRELAGQLSAQHDVDGDDTFYVAGAMLGDYFVAVGESDDDVGEIQDVLINGFGIALLVTTLFSLAAGALLSRRMQIRIQGIRAALERVSAGDLKQVIPGSDSRDDVGEVVGLVNKTVRDLRVVMDSVQQISNDIAHDLKRPLVRLQDQLALAYEGAKVGNDIQHPLGEALAQTRNIQRIFEALLRIAQIESGARRARFRPVDIAALLGDLHETFEPVANDANRKLLLACDEPTIVNGDEELLTQLFANLLENGICHTPEGSTITVGMETTKGVARAWVSDNGGGISEADREFITQRFYRSDKSRTVGGSGLGLSLVAAVVSLHDATLDFADNHPGLIVSITFRLARSL